MPHYHAPGWLLAGILGSSLSSIGQAGEDFPLKRVVLYSSGVAFHEHQAEIDGNHTVKLNFKVDDINDLLKSMVLEDRGGGRITTVTYGSKEPISKTLSTFAIDLTESRSLPDLLKQIRGEEIEIKALEDYKGTLVGIDTRVVSNPNAPDKEIEFITVLTTDGLCSIPMAEVKRVKLLNESMDKELRQALSVLATAHAHEKKIVELAFIGEGKRNVRVGYILESPVWKTSYRLVMRDNEPAHLQGWAMVENITQEDWKGVSLALVSGRPISFVTNLYEPLIVQRPSVVPEQLTSLLPSVFQQNLARSGSLLQEGRPMETAALSLEMESPATKRIRESLDKLISCDFKQTSLQRVAEYIAKVAQVPVVLDKNALSIVGKTPEEPISYSAKGIPLRSVLSTILKPIDLTYLVRDDAIVIVDMEETAAALSVKIYPVADLIAMAEPADLIELLQNIVFPDSWEENGGTATVEYFANKGSLVVTQSIKAHDELERLFQKLRQIRTVPSATGFASHSLPHGGGGFGGGGLGGGGGIGGGSQPDRSSPTEPMMQDDFFSMSVNKASEGAELGEMFQYSIDFPVTLARQQSAMIPIVNDPIEVEKLAIYNPVIHAKHPLRGVRLKNKTKLHLMQGPITVFDTGAYAGDGSIEDLAPDAERLIGYAVALDVEVAMEESSSAAAIEHVQIVKGMLHATRKHRREVRYFAKNSSDQPLKLVIEQSIRSDWELVEPKSPAEVTRDLRRFALNVEPNESAPLAVVEEKVLANSVQSLSVDEGTIHYYLSLPVVSEKVKDALREILDHRKTINDRSRQRNEIAQNLEKITTEQSRIRQNMQNIDEVSELYKRYVKKLDEQETEIESLRMKSDELTRDLEDLQVKMEKHLSELTLE